MTGYQWGSQHLWKCPPLPSPVPAPYLPQLSYTTYTSQNNNSLPGLVLPHTSYPVANNNSYPASQHKVQPAPYMDLSQRVREAQVSKEFLLQQERVLLAKSVLEKLRTGEKEQTTCDQTTSSRGILHKSRASLYRRKSRSRSRDERTSQRSRKRSASPGGRKSHQRSRSKIFKSSSPGSMSRDFLRNLSEVKMVTVTSS